MRGRGFGSIQSMLLLLLTSILSSAVVGWFGYRSGTEALTDNSYEGLVELRDERARAIQALIANFRGAVVLDPVRGAVPARG